MGEAHANRKKTIMLHLHIPVNEMDEADASSASSISFITPASGCRANVVNAPAGWPTGGRRCHGRDCSHNFTLEWNLLLCSCEKMRETASVSGPCQIMAYTAWQGTNPMMKTYAVKIGLGGVWWSLITS